MLKNKKKIISYESNNEVNDKLCHLGLSIDDMNNVALATLNSRSSVHPYSFSTAKGYIPANDALITFSDILLSRGWKKIDKNCSHRIVNPEGKISIMVASGDIGTGNIYTYPKTKSKKGKTTRDSLDESQLHLFDKSDIPDVSLSNSTSTSNIQLWVFLFSFNYNLNGNLYSISSELSRPSGMNDGDYIAVWEERIILPEIFINTYDLKDNNYEFSTGLDIKVERKK